MAHQFWWIVVQFKSQIIQINVTFLDHLIYLAYFFMVEIWGQLLVGNLNNIYFFYEHKKQITIKEISWIKKKPFHLCLNQRHMLTHESQFAGCQKKNSKIRKAGMKTKVLLVLSITHSTAGPCSKTTISKHKVSKKER